MPGQSVVIKHANASTSHNAVIVAVGRYSKKPYLVLSSGPEFEMAPISKDVTLDTKAVPVDVSQLWLKYQEEHDVPETKRGRKREPTAQRNQPLRSKKPKQEEEHEQGEDEEEEEEEGEEEAAAEVEKQAEKKQEQSRKRARRSREQNRRERRRRR